MTRSLFSLKVKGMKKDIWKYIAFGALGVYVYKQWQENPHTLGSSEEVKEKANRLIDNLALRANIPHLSGMIKTATHSAIDERMEIRDVTPV